MISRKRSGHVILFFCVWLLTIVSTSICLADPTTFMLKHDEVMWHLLAWYNILWLVTFLIPLTLGIFFWAYLYLFRKRLKTNESYKNLCDLGKILVLYLNNHKDKYPDDMGLLKSEFSGYLDFDWANQHIKFLGKGKSAKSNPPDMIIAFDKTRLIAKQDTYVLFNDAHVEQVSSDRAIEMGLSSL